MKRTTIVLLAALALSAAGCGPGKPKEISKAARAEAAQNASEAEFASQIRDWGRAESLLSRSVELDPENSQYWLHLGVIRRRLNNTSGARKAYERARDLLRTDYKRDKTSPAPLLVEIEVCILLGKPDDAKKVLETAKREHGDDPNVRAFVENNVLQKMMENPDLKSIGL